MTRIILMIEDKNYRHKNLENFLQRCFQTDPHSGSIEMPKVLSYSSPLELRTSLDNLIENEPDAEIIGALVDFSLNIQQYSDGEETFDGREADYGKYTVTTGIGVMDYLCRVKRYPRMKLWAMTTSDSSHGPLYYAAASLWFGAHPVDARSFNILPDASGVQVATESQRQLFWDLIADPRHIEADSERLATLRREFLALLSGRRETSVAGLDGFAWMAAMADTRVAGNKGGSKGWAAAVKESAEDIGRRKSESPKIEPRQLTSPYLNWCLHLQRILKYDEKGTDLIPDWPAVDPRYLKNVMREDIPWDSYNFFQNWMGDKRRSTLREFFLAEDVYAALVRWRKDPYMPWEDNQ